MLSLSKHLSRLALAIFVASLVASSTFARSKNRVRGYEAASQIDRIEAALKSNDVESAQTVATAYYQQAANVPALGSYSSALARTTTLSLFPPAMSTFPLGNNVAVWPPLATVMLPVAVKVLLAGSYSSALLR